MIIKLTHKQSKDIVTINTDGAKSNNDIKIQADNPVLLVAFNEALKIAIGINQFTPDYIKKFLNPETNKLDTYSDEYIKDVFIPKYSDLFDIEII